MEHLIGFSTGALAFGDFRRGLAISRREGLKAVELSALRQQELGPLVGALDDLDLDGFEYIGFHAPSSFPRTEEGRVVELLHVVQERGWAIVVHPDAIRDKGLWSSFGSSLCLENMDKRKSTGREHGDLIRWFEAFPDATFCLDLGHARQVDPTMTEAYFLLKHFGDRLKQIHMSEVTAASKHAQLSWGAISAMRELAGMIEPSVPIILESVVGEGEVAAEVARARSVFMEARPSRPDAPAQLGG